MNSPDTPSRLSTIAHGMLLCVILTLPCRQLSAEATSGAKPSSADGQALAMLNDAAKDKPKRSSSAPRIESQSDKSTVSQAPHDSPGLKLAQSQMRELVPLLEHLKKRAPQQYEKAIRDLDRSAKRLEVIKKRDQELFEIATREWTLRSETQLLKAKVRVTNSSIDAEQLKQLQRSMVAIQIERIEREIAMSKAKQKNDEERLKHLRRQLDKSSEPNKSQKPKPTVEQRPANK